MGEHDTILPRATRSGHQRFVPTIASLLVLLAIIPLSGAAFFAVREYNRVAAGSAQSEGIAAGVARLVEYSELRTHVLDERNWTLVADGLTELGVSRNVVDQFTGIDVDRELTEAMAAVDRLALSVGTGAEIATLEQLRSEDLDLTVRSEGYLEFEGALASLADRQLIEVQQAAGLLSGGDDVIRALQLLEHATTARRAVTLQLSTYFETLFSDGEDGLVHLQTLIAQRAVYDNAIRQFETLASDQGTSASAAAVRSLADAEAVVVFETAITKFTVEALVAGGSRTGMSVDSLLADIDEIAVAFDAGATSAVEHGQLVTAAGADATRNSLDVAREGRGATRAALWAIGILTVLSLAFAVALARFIASPLRQLAQAAHAVRRGAIPNGRVVRGPVEVRQVGAAVMEAGAHVALAERQARALANGALDDPILTETAPGLLGASLQEAVHTLAASLNDREKSRQRLAHDAAHDGLTDLVNRNASLAHLERSVERTQRGDGADLAVMFIDLDDFKSVNDRWGHLVGDHVLRVVAARLSEAVRDHDLVGRLGGDEFLVIASSVNGPENAIAIAERLRHVVSDPIPYEDDIIFRIDASIGIAVTGAGDDTPAKQLLRNADVAVYRAKEAGRGRIVMSDPSDTAPDGRDLMADRLLGGFDEMSDFGEISDCDDSSEVARSAIPAPVE